MICPNCSEKTFPKKKKIMDGWQVVGEILICPLCGKEIPESKKKPDQTPAASAPASARLSALLGGESLQHVSLAGKADRDFCRNCRNFIVHPFKSICALTDLETDPMGSCASFEDKTEDK